MGRSEVEARALTQSSVRESLPASGLVALSQGAVELPFAKGELLAGKYEVIGLLGAGGMGYVVSARHVELGEMVALKFLRPEALVHQELVERFAREARAAAKIGSEHIARVFDVGTLPDGVPFIVMEHLSGKDLADTLHHEGPLSIRVAVDYVLQACEALAAAHASGIVHRDIKPENLFLTRAGEGMGMIKVLDFGISKVALAQGKRARALTQMALGSPVYMSPEQIRSSDSVDARADIWAIGCVLFELLTGVTAFDEPSLLQLSAAILERDPVPLSTLLPEAPPELEAVVLRCLEKDPARRFQSVADLAVALYPFAPRRSRISVERCYHMLKSAGLVASDLELSSVYPPSMSGSGAQLRISGPALDIGARTTTPAAINIVVGEASVYPPTRGRLKKVIWLGLAGCAGALLLLRSLGNAPAANTNAIQSAASLPAARAPAARPPAEKPAPVVLDLDREPLPAAAPAEGSADPGAASQAKAPARAGKAASKQAARIARPAPAKGAPARPRNADEDLDPGF